MSTMANVLVDEEKLVYGLETGIGCTNTIFSSAELGERLRLSPCGLVSSAIHEYARQEGLPSSLYISSPNISIDPEMQHVIPAIGESEADQTVVDGSYSQFLKYVGLSLNYEKALGGAVYPKEKILVFDFSETDIVLDWLTEVSVMFQRRSLVLPDRWFDLGVGPLSGSSAQEVRQTFVDIWARGNMEPWVPPDYVQEHGRLACKHIPKGALSLITS
jgi:hypothetical protein